MTGFGMAITVSYHFWESWWFRMGWMCSTIGCGWSEQWGGSGFRFCVQEMFFCWSLTWGAVHTLRILVTSVCRQETLLKRWVYMCTSNWIHINLYYTFRIWEDIAQLRKGWKRIKFMIRKSYPTHYTPWSFLTILECLVGRLTASTTLLPLLMRDPFNNVMLPCNTCNTPSTWLSHIGVLLHWTEDQQQTYQMQLSNT